MRSPTAIAVMLTLLLTIPPFPLPCGGDSRTTNTVVTVKKEWTSPDFQPWDEVMLDDTDGDGASEFILACFTNNTVNVYDPPGYDLRFNASYSSLCSVETVDLAGNGSVRLLIGYWDDTRMEVSFTAIDGRSFLPLWNSQGMESYVDHRVEDVDADGRPELVFLTSALEVYDGATFQKEWASAVLGNESDALELANLDSDAAEEMVALTYDSNSNISNIYAFDGASHALQWESEVVSNGSFPSVLHIGDVDGDSTPELVLEATDMNETETLGTDFHVLSGASGAEEWNFSVEAMASAELADLDGDGAPECFVEAIDMGMWSESYNVTFLVFDMKDRKEAWKLGPFENNFSSSRQSAHRLADVNGDGLPEIVIINTTLDAVTGSPETSLAVFGGQTLAQLWSSPTFRNMPLDSNSLGIDPLAPVDVDSDGSPELVLSESWVQPPLDKPHGTVHVYSAATFTEEWNTGDLQSYAFGFGGNLVKDVSPEIFVLRGTEASVWADLLDPSTHKVVWESPSYRFSWLASLDFADILGGPWNEALFIGVADDGNGNTTSTLCLLNDTTLNQGWASEQLEGEAELLFLGDHDNDSHIETVIEVTKYDDEWNGISSLVVYDFWEGRPPMPDLALSAADLSLSNSTPFAGMPVRLTAQVRNLGDANATGCTVELLVDGGRVDVKTMEVASLNRTAVVFNWTAAQGPHLLSVRADPDNLLDEIEEGNNNASLNVTVGPRPPPLAVIASPLEDGTFVEGTPVNFSAAGSLAPPGGNLSFLWASDLAGTIGSVEVFSAALASGMHLITLTVNDGFNRASATVNVTVNPAPPPPGTTSAVMSSPKNGAVFGAGDQVLFDGSKSTASSSDYKLTFKWSSNASGQLGSIPRFWKALPSGNHNITLTVDDGHGGKASAHASIRVRPGEGVVAMISSPQEGEVFEADQNITFDGTASAGPKDSVLGFDWEDNATGRIGTEGRIVCSLPPGDHSVTLTVSDGKGHSASAVVNATVRPRPNQAPRITLLRPAEGAVVKGTVEISGTAWDDLRVEAVYLSIDGAAAISIPGGENWSYSWDARKVANGDHSLEVWAGDGSLLSSEVSVNVTVRNPAPSGPGGIGLPGGMTTLALAAVIGLAAASVMIVLMMKRRKGPEVVEVAAVEVTDERTGPGGEGGSGG